MTRSPRLVLIATCIALAVAACGSDDISKDRFTSELREKADLTEADASCISDRLYDELEQGEINDLYAAELGEIRPNVEEALSDASSECQSGG